MISEEQLSTELKKKRRYQCTTCSKAFSRPSALRTHMYTHTGEKPFECTTPGCGRRFAVISNLRRHFKVHRKVVHTNKIPASERLRHVQRLIERTTSSSMTHYHHHHPYPPIHCHSTPVLSNQRHDYQYQQQYFNNDYYQQAQSDNNKSPLSSLPMTALPFETYQQQQCYLPSDSHQQRNDTYALPLTPTSGNNSHTTLKTPNSSSYFKPLPKVPFVIMSDAPQQHRHHHHHHHPHHHHYYREPVFHWGHDTYQPSSSFGQA